VRPAKHAGKLHGVNLAAQLGQIGTDLLSHTFVAFLFAQLHQQTRLFQRGAGLIPAVDLLVQPGALLQALLRQITLIPEIRPGDFRFQLGDTLSFAIEVKDTSSARRAWSAADPSVHVLRETFHFSPWCRRHPPGW